MQGAGRGKMSKQAMAEFMKQKLKQTKIASESKTQASAVGPSKQNFT